MMPLKFLGVYQHLQDHFHLTHLPQPKAVWTSLYSQGDLNCQVQFTVIQLYGAFSLQVIPAILSATFSDFLDPMFVLFLYHGFHVLIHKLNSNTILHLLWSG